MTESIVAADRFSGNNCFLRDAGQLQLKMQHGTRARLDDDILLFLLEVGHGDGNRVFAQRHGAEVEFSVPIRFLVLHPIGSLRLQIDRCVLNGPVLGIMNDAMHGPEKSPRAPAQNRASLPTK